MAENKTCVDWVRCLVCTRTYINLQEANLGGCKKWSRPLDENGELLESEYPYETMEGLLKMGGQCQVKSRARENRGETL